MSAQWAEGGSCFACRLDSQGRLIELGNAISELVAASGRTVTHFSELANSPEEVERLSLLVREGSPAFSLGDYLEFEIVAPPQQPAVRTRWFFYPFSACEGADGYMAIGWMESRWDAMTHTLLQLSHVLDISNEAVVLIGPNGHVRYVNPSFKTATGYAFDEIMGKPISALVSIPEDISMVQDALASFRNGKMWEGVLRLRRKDGSAVQIWVRVRPMSGVAEGERWFMAVGVDMSLQRNLEKQVQELQRLESLSTLANGLAHRFNNILAAISGQTELLIMSCKDESVRARAEKILESALKGKEVVEQIGLFGRRSEPRSRLADIVPIVRNAVRFIRAAQPRCVQIEEDIPDEGRTLMVNTGEIHQVTLNLLTNALEAIGDKQGKIRISVGDAVMNSADGECIPCMSIEVSDDGPGVPSDIRPRIFEPFFTTHGFANSSGMGLAIAHGIVQRHGGSISCESELGKGATFRVLLPVFIPVRKKQPVEGEASAVCKGRILLVDKPGYSLESGKRVLEGLAYEVTALDDVPKAQLYLADLANTYDLLITALNLQGGDGVSLCVHSRRIRPKMPVMLCANMKENFDEKAALDSGASAILRRPAPREQLAELVDKLMDNGK